MPNTPFHYDVRFNLLAYDAENNFEIQKFTKVCKNKNPLVARVEAFEMFEEYLKFSKENNRLIKNDRGNFIIDRPTFVTESIINVQAKLKNEEIEKGSDWLLELAKQISDKNIIEYNQMKKFKEHIEIVLVIDSEDIFIDSGLGEIYKDEREFIIHRISSYDDYGEQQIVDNLEGIELTLFNHLKMDVSEYKKVVFHYGVDYGESGEDIEGAEREILTTPHIWCPIEEYRTHYPEGGYGGDNQKEEESTEKFYLDIIGNGESNQVEFKPTLLYNFNTERAGISVKYIIAKTIASFLNSNGGLLFVGVKDDKTVQGLDYDYSLNKGKDNRDYVLLELDSTISYFLNTSLKPLINGAIHLLNDKDVLVIEVSKSNKPVFLKNNRSGETVKEFYTRMHASTHQIVDIEDTIQYIFNKKWD